MKIKVINSRIIPMKYPSTNLMNLKLGRFPLLTGHRSACWRANGADWVAAGRSRLHKKSPAATGLFTDRAAMEKQPPADGVFMSRGTHRLILGRPIPRNCEPRRRGVFGQLVQPASCVREHATCAKRVARTPNSGERPMTLHGAFLALS